MSQSVYFLEDEEIDFDKALKEEVITVPPPVRYTGAFNISHLSGSVLNETASLAHWLAIEGIQPLVPENPTPSSSETKPATAGQGGPSSPRARKQGAAAPAQAPGAAAATTSATLVKHVLPRELQLYHDRLSAALVGSNERKRTAALSSLRSDAGLQALLPYLIRWVGETVVRVLKGEGASHVGDDGSDDEAMFGGDELDRAKLDIMLDALKAMIDNNTLFVEPYVSKYRRSIYLSYLTFLAATPNNAPDPIHSFNSVAWLDIHLFFVRREPSPSPYPHACRFTLKPCPHSPRADLPISGSPYIENTHSSCNRPRSPARY